MPDIFFSYKREDRSTVEKLVKILEDHGYSVWWDPAIVPGERYAAVIKKALNDASCVVVGWSEQSVESVWVQDEAASGRDRGMLLPISLDGSAPPLGFGQFQTADVSSWDGGASDPRIAKILSGIKRLVGEPSTAKSATVKTQSSVAIGIPNDRREGSHLESRLQSELGHWELVRRSRRAKDFVQFLTAFPNGRFSEPARSRLAQLNSLNATDAYLTLAAPAAITVFAAVALAALPQARDAYRVLALDSLYFGGPRPLFAFISMLLATLVTWRVSRDLSFSLHPDALYMPGAKSYLLRFIPPACALLIPIGSIAGLLLARSDIAALPLPVLAHVSTAGDLPADLIPSIISGARQNLLWASGLCGLLLSVIAILAFHRVRSREAISEGLGDKRRRLLKAGLATIALGAFIVFCTYPTSVGQLLGSITIFNIFVVLLLILIWQAIMLNERFGLWLLPGLSLFAVVLSLLGLNDNRIARMSGADFNPAAQSTYDRGIPPTDTAFLAWLRQRGDLQHYAQRGTPYPVFIVSVGGKGLYSAEFVASVLARLQDRCSSFSQHVFAIHAQSGATLGAAVFAGAVETRQVQEAGDCVINTSPSTGDVEHLVRKMLDFDFQAPLVAGSLFPDLVQRFFPLQVPALDRARAFEHGIEAASPRGFGQRENPLGRPFLNHWDPRGVAPALLISASVPEDGSTRTIAPFGSATINPPLSTAVGIAARGFGLLPLATVDWPQGAGSGTQRVQLGDSGRYDLSGVIELISSLQKVDLNELFASKTSPVKIHLLLVVNLDASTRTAVRNLFNSMTVERAISQTNRHFDDAYREGASPEWSIALGNLETVGLPTEWLLSSLDRYVIGIQVDRALSCELGDQSRGGSLQNCVHCTVARLLNGSPGLSQADADCTKRQ